MDINYLRSLIEAAIRRSGGISKAAERYGVDRQKLDRWRSGMPNHAELFSFIEKAEKDLKWNGRK